MASTSTSNAATPASVSTPTNVQTALGKTVINDGVVAKVAGIAAREVAGVFALGGGAARALGAIRGAMNSTDLSQGISVEVGETQVAIDVTIVVEYPAPLQQVADGVPPYLGVLNRAGPLAHVLPGVAALVARLGGLDDVITMRGLTIFDLGRWR
jgi:hypothetical protein